MVDYSCLIDPYGVGFLINFRFLLHNRNRNLYRDCGFFLFLFGWAYFLPSGFDPGLFQKAKNL